MPITKNTFQALYDAIDARDWETLPTFFDDQIQYIRPGFDDINGLDVFCHFYANIRTKGIASGAHSIQAVMHDGEQWMVFGRFVGVDPSGNPINTEFGDYFKAREGKFFFRKAYFHIPHI